MIVSYCLEPNKAPSDAISAMGVFSLEMPGEQLMQRVLCTRSEVDMSALRQGRLPQAEMNKVIMNAGPISEANIFIDDTAGINIFELRAKCRRLKMQHDIQMVVIDYLQLMSGGGDNKGNREQEISTISRNLKALAKELDIPVIAFSVGEEELSGIISKNDDKKNTLRQSLIAGCTAFATTCTPLSAFAAEELEIESLPPVYVPILFAIGVLGGVGVLTASLGNVMDEGMSVVFDHLFVHKV